MNKIIAVIVFFVFSTNTDAGEVSKRQLDPATIKKVKNMNAVKQCILFGKLIRHQTKDKDGKLRDALDAEISQFIRDSDYYAINDKKPDVGMSLCALIAAVGHPDHTNTSHAPRGTRIQAVYPNGMYVYIDDGIVTSWQE